MGCRVEPVFSGGRLRLDVQVIHGVERRRVHRRLGASTLEMTDAPGVGRELARARAKAFLLEALETAGPVNLGERQRWL
jgi:hypothetical protein